MLYVSSKCISPFWTYNCYLTSMFSNCIQNYVMSQPEPERMIKKTQTYNTLLLKSAL